MTQPKYNDPFNVVTDRGTAAEVAQVQESIAKEFGITGGAYQEIGRRDFGVLGKIVGFNQPGVAR